MSITKIKIMVFVFRNTVLYKNLEVISHIGIFKIYFLLLDQWKTILFFS